jgi:hypothetical protein
MNIFLFEILDIIHTKGFFIQIFDIQNLVIKKKNY